MTKKEIIEILKDWNLEIEILCLLDIKKLEQAKKADLYSIYEDYNARRADMWSLSLEGEVY